MNCHRSINHNLIEFTKISGPLVVRSVLNHVPSVSDVPYVPGVPLSLCAFLLVCQAVRRATLLACQGVRRVRERPIT